MLILDNLPSYETLDPLSWALVHPRVFPVSANLYIAEENPSFISLERRCFLDTDQIVHPIQVATDYWN